MPSSDSFNTEDFYNNQMNMAHLSCIRNVQLLPESSSLHSMDMLPVENGISPGLMAITLRTVDSQHLYSSVRETADGILPWTFEVRVVHGTDEVHGVVAKCAAKYTKNNSGSEESLHNGIWCFTLNSVFEGEPDYILKFSCELLESLIRLGWDVSTSGNATTTPGFESITWILKSGTNVASNNPEVNAIVINEVDGNLRVVNGNVQMNNVVKRALDSILNPKPTIPDSKETGSMDDSKSCDSDSLIKGGSRSSSPQHGGKKIGRAILQDDPDCPNVFEIEKFKMKCDSGKDGTIVCSNILLEIIHFMFCRQWKMIFTATLPIRDNKNSVVECDVLFFCRDGRILPSLGQQTFTMVELDRPNFVRLYNVGAGAVHDVQEVLQSEVFWPDGLESQDPDNLTDHCQEFRCQGSPWSSRPKSVSRSDPDPDDKLIDKRSIYANYLIAHLMLAMNKNELNVFSSLQIGQQKKNLLVFKHSSVSYSETLCIQLSGQNKVVIIGGGEEEVACIRYAITSRWPYPVSVDKSIQLGKSNHPSQVWLFKVKRYPWAVSYGNKYLDRTIEWTRGFLRRQVPIRSPQNSDTESGKSVLIFMLKNLMGLGWRMQMSADISPLVTSNRNLPAKGCNPMSIFLMR